MVVFVPQSDGGLPIESLATRPAVVRPRSAGSAFWTCIGGMCISELSDMWLRPERLTQRAQSRLGVSGRSRQRDELRCSGHALMMWFIQYELSQCEKVEPRYTFGCP